MHTFSYDVTTACTWCNKWYRYISRGTHTLPIDSVAFRSSPAFLFKLATVKLPIIWVSAARTLIRSSALNDVTASSISNLCGQWMPSDADDLSDAADLCRRWIADLGASCITRHSPIASLSFVRSSISPHQLTRPVGSVAEKLGWEHGSLAAWRQKLLAEMRDMPTTVASQFLFVFIAVSLFLHLLSGSQSVGRPLNTR